MPQTHAQEHALARHHAGRNPREHGAPAKADEVPAIDEKLRHPPKAGHVDSEKSKLPERGDSARKQAPNDRPGRKSGEGETPVG